MSSDNHSERLWQNYDILLHLCKFMDSKELILFANSSRLIRQTIVGRPVYWERQYKKKFPLGDRREQGWLTCTSLDKRESSDRVAILVWPTAGNPYPYIIYLECGHQDMIEDVENYFSDIYNEWILLYTKYPQYPHHQFDLFNLDGNQWIKESQLDDYNTSGCIQFASRDKCQFLTCTVIHDIGKFDIASTFMAIQDSQTVEDGNQSLYIQWELAEAQKGQLRSKGILSDREPNYIHGKTIDVLLLFFIFGKNALNTSPQALFDARDYDQLWPINNSDQGFHAKSKFDILDARDGTLLRSIACIDTIKVTPLLGSLCELFIWNPNKIRFIDMHTGRIYKPPACIASERDRNKIENEFLGLIKVESLPAASTNDEDDYSNM
ncbi:hypothetical protein BDF19DRAFT_419314 [Syncephalis fuscata]|nr:hypothetical protein BDF19DRAFT_419314 [Syncephalis fuscata]